VGFNGSGIYQRLHSWVADAAAGIKIRADRHDAEDDGFAAGLSNCITRDGQSLVTQNIPFNSKRVTGLQDPVNPQDASTKAYADTKLAKTGDSTMTGNLTIDAANPSIILDSDVGGDNTLVGKEDGKARWTIHLGDGTTEVETPDVANSGSNFSLNSHKDDGTALAVPLAFNRATGLGTVLGNPTDPLGIVPKQYSDATYQAKDAQLFAGIPPNHAGTDYTTVAADAQKMVCNAAGRPITIAINGALYPLGTTISIFAYSGYVALQNTEVMTWRNAAGTPTTGNRTLGQYGVATAVKWTTGNWVVSGNGLT
jgi:hypothetical protein